MKFLQRIASWFSIRRIDGDSASDLTSLIHNAYVHLTREEYEQARAPLLKAIASRDRISDPRTVRFLVTGLAATWLLTERYEEGMAFFSNYTARYPDDPDGYSEHAGFLWYAGRFQESVRNYTRALELNPRHILSLSGRGQVLAETGEYARAIEDLDSALKALEDAVPLDASSEKWNHEIEAFVRNGRGLALSGLAKDAASLHEFELSIDLSPENAWVYHNRAQFYDRAGRTEDAIADYKNALTKRSPALNPMRKRHAEARVRELSGPSPS